MRTGKIILAILCAIAGIAFVAFALRLLNKPKPAPAQAQSVSATSISDITVHKPPTEQQRVDKLAADAKAKGMKWTIHCTSYFTDEPESFIADAWRDSDEKKTTTPQGCGGVEFQEHCDHWLADGRTQGEAAAALDAVIFNKPTHPKLQPEKEVVRTQRICPPEITSDHPMVMRHPEQ